MSLDGGPTTRQTCGEDTLNIRTNYRENLGDTGLQHDNAMDNISHHIYCHHHHHNHHHSTVDSLSRLHHSTFGFLSLSLFLRMSFEPGPYVPLPLSDDRSETPPPEFNSSQPFTGLELIISGLPTDSFSAATDHLNGVVEKLRLEGAKIPVLHISSPANVQPLDFVYVSLTGPLKETLGLISWKTLGKSWIRLRVYVLFGRPPPGALTKLVRPPFRWMTT